MAETAPTTPQYTPTTPSTLPAQVLPRGTLAKVRRDILAVMRDHRHDDGSYAPLLIRFAWHCCGTYDAERHTGGPNGGTMRFAAEQSDPENAGLGKARDLLAPIHAKHAAAGLTTSDLCVLAGYVAIEAGGGPRVPFRYGRRDFSEDEACEKYGASLCPFGDGKINPNTSRLPAADLGVDDSVKDANANAEREARTIAGVRQTFARMGLIDQETVLLILLGHQFGRCHPNVSGFVGPWYAFDPAHWSMDSIGYFNVYAEFAPQGSLRECASASKRCDLTGVAGAAGKRQFNMELMGREWMLLPSDMALVWDAEYSKILQLYYRDRRAFVKDACAAWKKLTELGCDVLLKEEE